MCILSHSAGYNLLTRVFHSYIPSGSSKFGSFTIENIAGESTLQYHLYIDGQEKWSTLLVEPPVSGGFSSDVSFWERIGFT